MYLEIPWLDKPTLPKGQGVKNIFKIKFRFPLLLRK